MDILKVIKEVYNLPKVNIRFYDCNSNNIDTYTKLYKNFTQRHKKYKIIKNKTVGVALFILNKYKDYESFLKSNNGKNSIYYDTRKADRRGYKFIEIDRNNYIDDIYEINTSSEFRQGRKMSEGYLKKVEHYDNIPGYKYFGVVDEDGKLVAYLNVIFIGEIAVFSTLLGHNDRLKDGIMHFMISRFYETMYEKYIDKGYKYVMYDTFFGASEGLQKFKTKACFEPYRVHWVWEC